MADATTKKLVRLLRPENPTELRSAAALVLGEVGVRDAELTQVLLAALDDADPSVRLQALTAVGKLRIESALARLLERITEGGLESEVAAQAGPHPPFPVRDPGPARPSSTS